MLPEKSDSLLCPKCKEEINEKDNVLISAIDVILEPHYQIGKRYEIIAPVGRGGVGIVYKAKDYILDEIVALKILAPGLGMNQEIVERFKQETKITRRLSHNNIVRIYDIGKFDNRWYISMEYIDGKNLKTIIQEKGRLSILEALGIIKQVLRGLEVVHEKHIINRDIKPQNILIGRDGIVKIGDFSIAKSTEMEGLTSEDVMIVGSPEYMSPEQINGERIDNRTDIYSVGIVLYEMLTGKTPFESDTLITIAHKQVFELPTPPIELNPEIPSWLDKIILKCLAKRPADRYQEVRELISDLENQRTPKITFPQKENKIEISQKTFVRLKITAVASIIGMLFTMGIGGYFIQKYIQKYNESQKALRITQENLTKSTQKLAIMEAELQNLEIIKKDLETQVETIRKDLETQVETITQNLTTQLSTAEQKAQLTEEEKKRLLSELEAIKRATQERTPPGMTLVAAGEFIMGSPDVRDAQPQRKVYLDAFYIDKYEVTNEEYVKFLNAKGTHEGYIDIDSPYCKIEKIDGKYSVKKGYEKHPVVEVSWFGADAYAKWVGKRLPTEAEWEKAARGTDGRIYPWGNTFDRSKCNVNMQGTMPVGSYPESKSVYGCYDMGGNVWEWVADWYNEDYYKNSPVVNPKGPPTGSHRVWRGGSWLGNQFTVRTCVRNYLTPNETRNTGGFRCARDYN